MPKICLRRETHENVAPAELAAGVIIKAGAELLWAYYLLQPKRQQLIAIQQRRREPLVARDLGGRHSGRLRHISRTDGSRQATHAQWAKR